MIKKTVENLRRRPDHHKKMIAFGVASVVSGFIFSVWLSSQTFIGNNGPQVIAAAKEESPLQVFGKNIASGIGSIEDAFGVLFARNQNK